MLDDHNIEPELLGRLPRKVRRRAWSCCAVGCAQLFILPHTLLGILMLLTVINRLCTLCFGTDANGTVSGWHTTTSEKSGATYYLDFRYRFNNCECTGYVDVPMEDYKALSSGSTLPLKLSPLMPGTGAQVPPYAWRSLRNFTLFALFWNVIVSVFVWIFYINPFLIYLTMIVGCPVRGVITDKKIAHGRGITFMLHYQFQPRGATAPRKGRMAVTRVVWGQWDVGHAITVLYLPRHPWFSVLYPCTGYEVIGAAGTSEVESGQ